MTTYIVNFHEVVPPIRYDGNPWTSMVVQECATGAGPFTTIDTIDLSTLPGGLDSDPSEPQSRNVTITNATVAAGFYVIFFTDVASNQSQPTTPIQNAANVAEDIRPTIGDLGSIMHTRTVAAGTGGSELGTFTAGTRPTAAQAEAVIDQAVSQVLLKVGPGVVDNYRAEARTVVLYLAAMLVEVGFFKDEIAKEISAFPLYQQMYRDSLEGLTDSMNAETPGTPTLGFFTIPVMNSSQANFQYLLNARDPTTGMIDPTKLPPDMNYPNGIGGLPADFYAVANGWPLFLDVFDSASFLDSW